MNSCPFLSLCLQGTDVVEMNVVEMDDDEVDDDEMDDNQ